jgi:hypothetical protein
LNIVFASLSSPVCGQVSCPLIIQNESDNFIASPNSSTTTLWLNLHVKLNSNQLTASGDYLMFSGGALTFTGINTSFGSSVSLPGGEIIADATAGSPSTSFNSSTNTWITRVSPGYSSPDLFISGAAITSSIGYTLSGGNNSTTLTGVLTSNKLLSSTRSYGLACYQASFSNNSIGSVNAANNIPVSGYVAGTPTIQTGNLVAGGSGSGGANYTGTLSLNYNFTACVNTSPTAYAGPDQQVAAGTSSTSLSGSGTGTSITYAWTKTAGGSATITSPASASTTVTGLAAGNYTFLLTVTDNAGNTATSSMNVAVNALPTASAGSNQTLNAGITSATLSGSGTGTSITYAWTQTAGGSATITSPTSASTTVTGLTAGAYTFLLTVTDNAGNKATSSVNVTVTGGNVLTIEGTTTNLTATDGDNGVNIPRSVPTTFSFLYNYISSVANSGYMLQAGDENPGSTNGNLNGEMVSGNYFYWYGTGTNIETHGLFTAYNINAVITYNYLYQVPMSIIQKGGINTGGAIAYNIINNPQYSGVNIKGMSNSNIYNNTFYSNLPASNTTFQGFVNIYLNTVNGINVPSHGTHIYNNIFYTVKNVSCISLEEYDDTVGLRSDYNLYYCETGTPTFKIANTYFTLAQWQAFGYDIHSVVVNPNFIDFTNFVPSAPLYYGTNLGTSWQTGLAANAIWSTSAMPATANQGNVWQVGARVVPNTILTPAVLPNLGLVQDSPDSGAISVSAYPNPYASEVNFNITSPVSGKGTIEIYDILGSEVARVFVGDIMAGSPKTVTYRLGPTQRQLLIYILKIGNKIIRGKLVPRE